MFNLAAMRMKLLLLAGTTTCLLLPGCDKPAGAPGDKGLPEVPGQQAAMQVSVPVAAPAAAPSVPAVAEHLGIATRVPADADIFLAGYHADEAMKEIFETLVKTPFFFKKEDDPTRPPAEDPSPYVGDEAFLFVSGGPAAQLQVLCETYRDISALSAGTMAGNLMGALGKEPDGSVEPSKINEQAALDMLNKWMNAVEKDSRMQVPGVVTGWKPAPDKLAICQEKLTELLAEVFKGNASAKPVSFESGGMTLSGFEVGGREVFGKAVDEMREALAKEDQGKEILEQLSPERIERLLVAVENLHLTVAAGTLDGRILVYIGNGKEGFKLAATPEQSLAATADLKWTQPYAGKKLHGVAYLSQGMTSSVLPLLDSSEYWNAIAKTVGPPIRDERLFRDLLSEIAINDKELSRRDVSAWSAISFQDAGWKLETRGGWQDPGLDYTTPLHLTAPAAAQSPAIRAHWVQNRSRKDLEWKRLEMFGLLGEAAFQEFMKSRPQEAESAKLVPEVLAEIRNLNRGYREEFRAGVGDELAFIADFKGEVPPLPGVSEESVRDARMPRFVIAREVKNRALIDASGRTYGQVWKNLTEMVTKNSGTEIPAILPQKLESDDLVTWYAPAPFIGGDFVPGVNVNDKLWMFGTSQSMARGMAKAMSAGAGAEERGVIVEMDFAPMWDWFGDVFKRADMNAERFVEGVKGGMSDIGRIPGAVESLPDGQGLTKSVEQLRKIKGLSYRHRLEDGKPRTSLHVKVVE